MTSQYRHRRTSNPATAFPNPLEPGEIAVNTANRQIAIGDAQSGVIGAPLPAIAVRYFDIRAQYVANDFVQNGTSIYRAKGPISPGPFNITQWDMMVGAFDPQYVAKAGDTMTGMLNLPATVPSSGTHATNKTYVDTGLAGKSTVYSATSPPAGVADNSMWFETDTGLLYVKYNDGSTSQWVIACPQPDISNFVLRSGDNMSGPLGIPLTPTLPAHATSKSYVDAQLAGKSSIIASDTPPVGAIDNSLWYETDSGATYVRYNDLNGGAQWVAIADPANTAYAAPFDAMAYSGMQINGSMEVSQELGAGNLTSVAGVTFSKYILDGWVGIAILPTGSVTFGQTPMAAEVPGLQNSFQFVVGTARASLSGSDTVRINHSIEGYRFSRVAWGTSAAVPVTVGFWVRATLSGTYRALMMNSGGATVTPWQSFTLTGGPAFQWVTITFPAQTTGTWLTTNGIGAQLLLEMASPSTPNLMATAGNYASITGVVVLPGIEAPRADRSALIMRPFDQELVTCKRYYQKPFINDLVIIANSYAAGQRFDATYLLPVEMRSAPTMAFSNISYNNSSALTANGANTRSFDIFHTATTAGLSYTGAILTLDARL